MMSEYDVHKEIVKHFRLRGIPGAMPVHINNNPRSKRDGARLKALGLVAGVPDLIYVISAGMVIWHEIKTEKGRLSPKQKAFHRILDEAGHKVLVTYGLDDALGQLTEEGIIK